MNHNKKISNGQRQDEGRNGRFKKAGELAELPALENYESITHAGTFNNSIEWKRDSQNNYST